MQNTQHVIDAFHGVEDALTWGDRREMNASVELLGQQLAGAAIDPWHERANVDEAFRLLEETRKWPEEFTLNASVRLLGYELGVQPRRQLEKVGRPPLPVPERLSR